MYQCTGSCGLAWGYSISVPTVSITIGEKDIQQYGQGELQLIYDYVYVAYLYRN